MVSICPHCSPAAAAYGGFAVLGLAGMRYRSIAAWPMPQQHGAAALTSSEHRSKCM